MYTSQHTLVNPQGVRFLTVKANGGTVVVERQVGDDWIIADTFDTDGSWPLTMGRSPTRFTPTGGAAFEVQE